jgi:hypothetical protein
VTSAFPQPTASTVVVLKMQECIGKHIFSERLMENILYTMCIVVAFRNRSFMSKDL